MRSFTLVEILNHNNKIKTVDDLVANIDAIIDLARDDVQRIARSKNLCFYDFDFTYNDASEMLKKTIQKTHLRAVQKFLKCENINNAIRWLNGRLLNNMRNITTNQNYKLYCKPPIFSSLEVCK